jgi:menaquinone-dependent protoporphyrinogen oxidase
MKAIIIYHTKYGQTEKIAKRISQVIESRQVATEVFSMSELNSGISFEEFDLVLIGAPIYLGDHSKKVARLIKKNLDVLNNRPSAFFSVSLSAGGNENQRNDAAGCVNKFLEKTQWKPNFTELFGGGLPYRKYNWFIRMLMKWISGRAGGSTDTSINHEYTDWQQVDAFANKLLEKISAAAFDTKSAHVSEMA